MIASNRAITVKIVAICIHVTLLQLIDVGEEMPLSPNAGPHFSHSACLRQIGLRCKTAVYVRSVAAQRMRQALLVSVPMNFAADIVGFCC